MAIIHKLVFSIIIFFFISVNSSSEELDTFYNYTQEKCYAMLNIGKDTNREINIELFKKKFIKELENNPDKNCKNLVNVEASIVSIRSTDDYGQPDWSSIKYFVKFLFSYE